MKRLDNVKLLQLVADDELVDFARACALDDRSAARESLATLVEDLEPRVVIDAILAAKGTSLRMMAEVFGIVARHGASLRTTGCVVVLPGEAGPVEHAFSRQALSMMAAFSNSWSIVGRNAAFAQLASSVEAVLVPCVRNALQDGGVRSRWKVNSKAAASAQLPFKRVKHVDSKIQRSVDALVPPLRSAYQRVAAAIGAGPPPTAIEAVAKNLTSLEALQKEWRRVGEHDTNAQRNGTFDAQVSFARARLARLEPLQVVDQLVKLADTVSEDARTDLVQLSLLRDRPRIFELWVMMKMLERYEQLGAKISLHGVAVEDERWMLNFARASRPVASLALYGRVFALYYQRFVPGAMPDVSLEDVANASTVWVVDPKYSEKGGYTLASYEETARRYQKAFSPSHSIVAEFFPRPDLGIQSPKDLGSGAAIVLDVGPDKPGWTWLSSTLLATLPALDVLAIDVSSSYLAAAKEMARALPTDDPRWAVAFGADVATIEGPLVAALDGWTAAGRSQLGPLVAYLEQMHKKGVAFGRVEIWSDGELDDADVDALLGRLRGLCADLQLSGGRFFRPRTPRALARHE